MGKVKLVAALPKDDTGLNGLDEAGASLVQRPKTSILVIGRIINPKTEIDHKRGVSNPQAEFVHIEVVTSEDYNDAEKLLERTYRRRTGQNPDQIDLPI